MKVFKMVKRHYAILGIIPSLNQPTQKYPINKRVFCGFLLFGCFILSQIAYTFCVADGFMEYLECACDLSASVILFVCFATIVFKKDLLFEIIDKFGKLIDTSTNYFKIIIQALKK